ncbi:MAG: glycerol-3-phosphate 1-O-acyltransferase PlsY, partial [Firmicutes bacterium]|nr:glycerol-3-phosphate 1-O-acyltransferase PlsY [Bacillota bacterium]
MYIDIIFAVLIGYVLGSIPFALVIGKVFYKTDIRQHGSHNLGGGNAGRVLGKKAGLAVMTCDILKVTLAVFLVSLFADPVPGNLSLIIAGFAAAMGHCFPLFAHFKGGKAVATMYGFLFGMALIAGYSFWIFFVPLITFLVVLYIWRIVSLSSLLSAIVNTVFIFFTADSLPLFIASLIFTLIILIRHRKNWQRLLHGT